MIEETISNKNLHPERSTQQRSFEDLDREKHNPDFVHKMDHVGGNDGELPEEKLANVFTSVNKIVHPTHNFTASADRAGMDLAEEMSDSDYATASNRGPR